MANAKKMSMKLLVDKSKNKVLFAEAGKDCVDFLFHILSLPLGSVVGYLTKASMVGSIGSLYESLENLGTNYVQEGVSKDCLLKPKPAAGSCSNVPLLTVKPDSDDVAQVAKKFFTCIKTGYDSYEDYHTTTIHRYVSDAQGIKCPECHVNMRQPLVYVAPPVDVDETIIEQSVGYVKGVVTYMILDDLSVQPMSSISSIMLLNKFNVEDVSKLEEREVTLDIKLGVALIKASLMSKTVLTDVFMAE